MDRTGCTAQLPAHSCWCFRRRWHQPGPRGGSVLA
jgi:hypothetical protein